MKDNKHIQTFEQHQENLNISDVRGSSYDEDTLKWGEIFDDMKTSPYIDIKNVRESDRIAIFSWLSSNFHAPIKRDKQQWDWITSNGCKYKQLLWKTYIEKQNLIINQQHLFGSDEIIAYICCYKQ